MKKVTKFIKDNLSLFILTPVVLIVDRVTKIIARTKLAGHPYVPLIGDFVGFCYVENDGAAWNMFGGSRFFLSLISIVSSILILIYYFKGKNNKYSKFFLAMIFVGAVGNGIDRIIYGKVIDMINVNIFILFNSEFPIFNVADLFVTFGAILFILFELFKKNEQ